MKFFPLFLMALGAMIVGCERHEFEGENGTRQLHEKSVPSQDKDADDDGH